MPIGLTQILSARPMLATLHAPGRLLVGALRISILAQRRSVDPMAILSNRLNSRRDAQLALHIIGLAGDLWPERFILSPPCCASMSHDEALLGTLADCAAQHDRPAFDRASSDLLNEDRRDQLWRELIRWQ